MPFSVAVALPCALLTVLLKILPRYIRNQDAQEAWELLGFDEVAETISGAAFSGVNFLIGFLVVFRSSQAYNRFWEGLSAINGMQGEWWDATSSLVAFCKCAKCAPEEIILFQHTLVRLVSILNGCVLMELSAGFNRDEGQDDNTKRAFELELIDAEGIDMESLRCLNGTTEKVELVFQWVQQLIVESDIKGVFSVTAPLISRAFQELSNGMVQYRQASKIARTPLPFPYMQATELLLISHWLCTPVLMCVWVESALWAGILSFIQVMFYWSLNSIATELENPFGEDDNDLPAKEIQQDFNTRLLLLIRPGTARTARLSKGAAFEETKDAKEGRLHFGKDVRLGQNGVPMSRKQSVCSRMSSLAENRITWGSLHSSIQEKIALGYTSENNSEESSLLPAKGASRSRSRTHSKTVDVPKLKSPQQLLCEEPAERKSYGSKDVPLGVDIVYVGEGLPNTERVGSSHLAYLASLPELVRVCTDVRDQLKAAVEAEEDHGRAGSDAPRAAEGLVPAPGAFEAPLAARSAKRVLGKPLGDGGCLGMGSCSSRASTSRV